MLAIVRDTGDSLWLGTEVRGGSLRILPGQLAGDNNGNEELDVGDATLRIAVDPSDTVEELEEDNKLTSILD